MNEAAVTIGATRALAASAVLQRAPMVQHDWPDPREAPLLGRLGGLEVRLARGAAEIRAAQSLRYRVFYGEMNARANVVQQLTRLDSDRFDRHCDHLLVIDPAGSG